MRDAFLPACASIRVYVYIGTVVEFSVDVSGREREEKGREAG